jgi:tRNA threonylcarbamoyladenosine biosynthesis protein TsaE
MAAAPTERTPVILPDEEATLAWGRHLGERLPADHTVALSGELGAGKTTLVRGLAEGLGTRARVKSPTYTYLLSYPTARGTLVHLDAYRLGGADDYAELLLEEQLSSPWFLCVEWPERVGTASLPHPLLHLRLAQPPGIHGRQLTVEEGALPPPA